MTSIHNIKNKIRMNNAVPTINTIMPATQKELEESSDEEELEIWDPTDGNGEYDEFTDILPTLDVFKTFRVDGDGRKMKKKEIKESYKNFDKWIDHLIEEQIEEKNKSDILNLLKK